MPQLNDIKRKNKNTPRAIKLDEEMVQKEPIQVEVQKDNFLEVEETLTLLLKVVN